MNKKKQFHILEIRLFNEERFASYLYREKFALKTEKTKNFQQRIYLFEVWNSHNFLNLTVQPGVGWPNGLDFIWPSIECPGEKACIHRGRDIRVTRYPASTSFSGLCA